MKTSLECIPCFFKQALDAAKLAGANRRSQKKIINALSKEVLKFKLTASPPEMGRILYGLVRDISGKADPFKQIKRRSNRFALGLYPRLKKIVERSKDRLLCAVELAIAGNVIDYGVKNSLNIAQEIDKIFRQEKRSIRKEDKAAFNISSFKRALKKAKQVLYLADNSGEVVFDRLLIEEILRDKNKQVTYAVRDKPIINDALAEDALFCGIGKYAKIISTGSDAPGTIPKFCSKAFLRLYQKAEFIISKGQGNFEALSASRRPIFFLFKAKCPIVARHLNCKLGDIILKEADYAGMQARAK